jgi:hypothetical protein
MYSYSKTPINSKNQQFIRVSDPVWEDGLKISERVGFLEVKPESADRNLERLKSGALIAEFGNKNEQTNLFEIVVVKPETVGETELAHNTASN